MCGIFGIFDSNIESKKVNLDENFNLLSKKNSLSELIKKDLKNANIQKNII